MVKYPNLELIEYIFNDYVMLHCNETDSKNMQYIRYSIDTFLQTWGNTATGFDLNNTFSGQAFTDEYTTVIKCEFYDAKNKEDNTIYGIFFGNRLAYKVVNPNQKFYDDLQSRTMESQKNVIILNKYK